MNEPSRSTSSPLRRLWWLQPVWPFALIVGSTMLIAYFQSDDAYALYRTPKYVKFWHLGLAGAAIFAFAVGAWLAGRTGRIPAQAPEADDRTIRRWFYITTALSFFGYAGWLVVGVKNGFSLRVVIDLLTGADENLYEKDFFPTVAGVTTSTQFALAALMLGLYLYLKGDRRVVWPLVGLILLAFGRAIVFSERTAIIELVVPAFLVVVRKCVLGIPWSRWARIGFRIAPILGPITLILFFGASEYIRSWRFYQHEFDSYPEFVVWRLSGYYSTALNNGAMTLETHQRRPLPYYVLRDFWLFPGVRSSPFAYHTLTGVDVEENHTEMLKRWGNFELNNESGLFQPTVDLGIAGAILFWFGYGFLAGRLYRSFQIGTIAGVTIYPIIYLSILEVPLVLFLCYPRLFPTFCALIAVCWVTRPRAEPQRESQVLLSQPSEAI